MKKEFLLGLPVSRTQAIFELTYSPATYLYVFHRRALSSSSSRFVHPVSNGSLLQIPGRSYQGCGL